MFAEEVVKQLLIIVYSKYISSYILNYYDPLTHVQGGLVIKSRCLTILFASLSLQYRLLYSYLAY